MGVVANLADDLPGGVLERAGEAVADRAPTDALGIGGLAVGAVACSSSCSPRRARCSSTGASRCVDDGERLTAARGLLTRRLVVLERDADPRRRRPRHAAPPAVPARVRDGDRRRTARKVGRDDARARAARRRRSPALLRAVDPAAPDPAAPLDAAPGRRRAAGGCTRALALPLARARPRARAGRVRGRSRPRSSLTIAGGRARARPLPPARPRLRRTAAGRPRRAACAAAGRSSIPAAAVAFELRSSPGQRRAGLCTRRRPPRPGRRLPARARRRGGAGGRPAGGARPAAARARSSVRPAGLARRAAARTAARTARTRSRAPA